MSDFEDNNKDSIFDSDGSYHSGPNSRKGENSNFRDVLHDDVRESVRTEDEERTEEKKNMKFKREKPSREPSHRGSGRFLAGVLGLALLLGVGTSSMVVTRQDEYSVIKQFGAIVRVENEPGLSFRIPFIQQVSTLDNTLLYYDIPSSDVITSDKKTMIVDSYVIWRITDAKKYIKTLSGSNSNAQARLNTIVYNAVKNTISSMTQDEVIASRDGNIVVSDVEEAITTNDMELTDEELIKPANVKIKSLTDEITGNLADFEDYGIEIVKTEVKVLDLPDANKEAVYERMISERNNVAASYEAQGKADAQVIINTTDKEVRIMEAEAEAQAAAIVADGEAQYMQILSGAYSDASKAEFYSFVRSLDAAKASLVNTENILILNEDSPIAKIFY